MCIEDTFLGENVIILLTALWSAVLAGDWA